MDILKSAINSEVKKRKKIYEKVASGDDKRSKTSGNETGRKFKKYVRVVDLERAKEEENENSRNSGSSKYDNSNRKGNKSDNNGEGSSQNMSTKDRNEGRKAGKQSYSGESLEKINKNALEGESHAESDEPIINSEEIIKRLRARGEPIRLFGEDDRERRLRLRRLELSEEHIEGQSNEFRRMLAQVEARAMLDELKKQANMDGDEEEQRRKKYAVLESYDTSVISTNLLRTDIRKLSTLLYVYFKRMLYEWEDYLLSRSEEERRSPEGKMAAATQRQSAEYLKPFFRLLKHKTLEADVMARVTEIARNMIDREYMKANDAYLQLSVGNAPWPIGVTQVGIHARAARENIFAEKVAHVLNDETQRKWIQSIKRLMKFAQTKYPPEDLAKMVG